MLTKNALLRPISLYRFVSRNKSRVYTSYNTRYIMICKPYFSATISVFGETVLHICLTCWQSRKVFRSTYTLTHHCSLVGNIFLMVGTYKGKRIEMRYYNTLGNRKLNHYDSRIKNIALVMIVTFRRTLCKSSGLYFRLQTYCLFLSRVQTEEMEIEKQ